MNTNKPSQDPTPSNTPNTQMSNSSQSIQGSQQLDTLPTVQNMPPTTPPNSMDNADLPLDSNTNKKISLKKVFSISLISILALVGLLAIVTVPLVNDLSKCYKSASEEFARGQISAKNQNWSKQQICLNGKEIIDSTTLCFREAEQGGVISAGLITNLAKIISPGTNQFSEFKKMHNQACQQFPLLQVD
jgi:hypothetical protein